MARPQPFGIKVWGALLILVGGFTSLITVLEIFDSIRFYGLDSILLVSPGAVAGFLIYGMTPVLLYSTGVGLFMSREWARTLTLLILPVLLFFFVFNQALRVATLSSDYAFLFPDIVLFNLDIFAKALLLYLAFTFPMMRYFSQRPVKEYFLLKDI